jgi:hypothetical protein
MNFFLWYQNTEHGPYDLNTVNDYIREGKLSQQMLARLETDDQWKPLGMLLPKISTEREDVSGNAKQKAAPAQEGSSRAKPTNTIARNIGVLLCLLAIVCFGLAYSKSGVPKGSLEALLNKQSEDMARRIQEDKALAKLARSSGSSRAAEAEANVEDSKEALSEKRTLARKEEAEREATMRTFLTIGALLAASGVIVWMLSAGLRHSENSNRTHH